MKAMEEQLQELDFSKFSKVQNALLLKMLGKRRGQNMSVDELDMVAAAGNGYLKDKKLDEFNKK